MRATQVGPVWSDLYECEWARPPLLTARTPAAVCGLRCAGCGARVQRDVHGSAHSCSKAASGRYGLAQADAIE